MRAPPSSTCDALSAGLAAFDSRRSIRASVLANAKESLPGDAIASQTMRFGHLDLGKRKAQRVLAPVFMTSNDG